MKKTAKAEVLAEAKRLGASSDVIRAAGVNFGAEDWEEELHGDAVLPSPQEATDEEWPLAAAVANVRKARGAELGAARTVVEKVALNREARQRGAEIGRAMKRSTRERDEAIGALAKRNPDWSAEQLRVKLLRSSGIRSEVLGPESSQDAVPSRRTIQRLLKRLRDT